MKTKKKVALTSREFLLIGLLALILVGFAYYNFYYTPNQNKIASLTSDANSFRAQTTTLSSRVEEVLAMKNAVADAQNSSASLSIPDYDNSKPMITELNQILSSTEEFDISFGYVSKNDYIYERPVSITFKADSYPAARAIIARLDDSEFFNMISDVTINSGDSGFNSDGQKSDGCSVSLTITYFEVDG